MSSSRQRRYSIPPRRGLRLGLLRALAAATLPLNRRSPTPLPEAPRFLLIRPDHIGDLLFAAPAFRVLRQALPKAHLSCMVGPWGKAVLESDPNLDELILCDFPGFSRGPKGRVLSVAKGSLLAPYRTLLRWSKQLAPLKFDAALVLRFDHWWGALLAYLAGIPCRIGYAVPECQPFLTESLSYDSRRHEVQQNLALVHQAIRLAGRQPPEDSLALDWRVPAQDQEYAAAYLEKAGFRADEGFFAIHPGAGAPVKLWRPEAFGQVADALRERYHLRCVITGGPDELDLAWSVYAHMRSDALVVAGHTTLAQLAALFQRSRLVIGPDCGPLHLAVAVGAPTVHLYGPADALKFGPVGDPGKHVVITSSRHCIPCNRLDYAIHELSDHPCVLEITPQQVLEAARRLLALPT